LLKNENRIFNIASDADFSTLALEIFNLQYDHNNVYRSWVDLLKIPPTSVKEVAQIPFLPIEFFKSHKVVAGDIDNETVSFTSSATTSVQRATHYVTDISVYEKSFLQGFRRFYGNPEEYCFLFLLPSYRERKGSSLVYMCNSLAQLSSHPETGFFLNELDLLQQKIELLNKTGQKTILLGVSYALMDLADRNLKLQPNITVMETGGMKGTRKEMLKPELHAYLQKGFSSDNIHSEYGMTELLSQAYSTGDGLFESPPWMRFYTREVDDPFSLRNDGRTGGINVVDLANHNSCSFIATKDLGRLHKNKLELMGRFDHSDVRGCNLMMSY